MELDVAHGEATTTTSDSGPLWGFDRMIYWNFIFKSTIKCGLMIEEQVGTYFFS